MNREMELRHLRRANINIAQGERRIAAQAALVGRMTAAGQSSEQAKDLLERFQGLLTQWHKHRQLILEALDE